MTTYSLLFIGMDDSVKKSKRIECSSDELAIDMAAQEPDDYRDIQVWDGDRPITLVDILKTSDMGLRPHACRAGNSCPKSAEAAGNARGQTGAAELGISAPGSARVTSSRLLE